MNQIHIIDYEDMYWPEYQRLSYEWLEEYSLLEPEDVRILSNPREAVLDRGGYIFFAECSGEIIGTVSLIRVDAVTFELAKLAVAQPYRGLGIGSVLIQRCLETADKENIHKIILFTNHKLLPAIALYRKFNFRETEHANGKYIKSDLKMELEL